MKTYKRMLRALSALLAVVTVSVSMAACSSDKNVKDADNSSEIQTQIGSDSEPAEKVPYNPVTQPGKKDKTLKPDVDSIKLEKPSSKLVECASEEECIEALSKFANPEGNEYDALSVLGKFRYPDLSEDEMMKTVKTASDTWHKKIVEDVGEKCIVRITLDEKAEKDMADPAVAEWNSVNGKTAEAYTNVKCYVATNYVDEELKISFDLVKIDGNWYLANMGTLGKISSVITDELYR